MIRTLLESVTGYPGLLVACATSGILLPMPEDFPLLYAGMRIADGSWGWGATIAVGIVGVAIRDTLAWTFGRSVGELLLRRQGLRRWFGGHRIDRARQLISKHGASAVLIGRFMVGFRTPMFAVAGAMGVPLRAFAAWDAIGLAIAVPLSLMLGYQFGHPLADAVLVVLQRTRLLALILFAVVVAAVIWRMSLQSAPDDERESDTST